MNEWINSPHVWLKAKRDIIFSCNHQSCYVSCPRYYEYTDEILMLILAPDMETNECLINNGGCWQDVKANITACKVHVTLFLTNNTSFHKTLLSQCLNPGVVESGFKKPFLPEEKLLYLQTMISVHGHKTLKNIYECCFHNHHAVFL